MVNTLQALILIWLAILPGTMFVWFFEQLAGRWTTSIRSSLLRSVGYSAIFHVLVLPFTYHLWSSYRDQIIEGEYVNLLVWPGVAIYVIVPLSAAFLVERFIEKLEYKQSWWARTLAGRYPVSSVRELLFSPREVSGWVRLHTKFGESIVGFYGRGSYSAKQDIYLAHIATVDDADELQLAELDKARGLLIRWDEVEYMEFLPRERSRGDG